MPSLLAVEERVALLMLHIPFYSSWAVCLVGGEYKPFSWRKLES